MTGNLIIKDFKHDYLNSEISFTVECKDEKHPILIKGTKLGYDSEHFTINEKMEKNMYLLSEFDHLTSEEYERLFLFVTACGELVYEGFVL